MNKPALRKLVRHLIRQQKSEEAARFNMRYFGIGIEVYGMPRKDMLEVPVCNTQACLAGEAVLSLNGGFLRRTGGIDVYKKFRIKGFDIEDTATKLLDLTREESRRLFFFTSMNGAERKGWPEQFEKEYNLATTPADRIEVAIRRVAHFINTDGLE
jgi:hypothetical protein